MPPDAIAPDGSEIYFKVNDSERASMVEVRLAAGAVSRPVRHRTVEEHWYVLAGSGRLWRLAPGGRGHLLDLKPGDAIRIPTGWAFQFAAGEEELRFACFTAPAWPGQEEAEPVQEGGLGAPTV